jgi:hypothetical protein
MGDDATTQRINTMVVLTVIVKAPKGKLVPFTAAFSVIEMKHHMIIGLPDLVTALPVFFISRFRAAAGRSAELLSSLTYDHKGIRANRPAHLGRAVTERHFSRVASLASTYAEDRPSGDSSFKPSDFSAYQALEPLDIVEPWSERDIVAHVWGLFKLHGNVRSRRSTSLPAYIGSTPSYARRENSFPS